MRDLHHVTLATGDARRSPRSEVEDATVAALRPLLARVWRGERVAVPAVVGYSMTGAAQGRCGIVTLAVQMPDAAGPEPVPVLTIGVAGHSRCGAHLWRLLHDGGPGGYGTDPDRVPPEPWCADRLEVGAATLGLEAMNWTGDFSRCVAWTFLLER